MGDNVDTDIVGAKQTRMNTVLVQNDPTVKTRGSTAYAIVDSLKLLPKILSVIQSEET